MSTPRTKRHEQAVARREQLLQTAVLLFSENGYRATSVRDIARVAGVNEGLLYHYFTSKADLFRAVLAQYAPFRALGAFLDTSASLPEQRPLDDALQSFGREFLARLRQYRAFVVTILTESANVPELGAILSEFLHTTGDDISRFLAEYQKAGQIDPKLPLAAASRVLQGSLLFHFLAETLRLPSSPEDDDQTLADLITVLLSGLRPASS